MKHGRKRKWKTIVKWLLLILGGYFLFLMVFAFTTTPFWVYYYFGTYHSELKQSPAYIVVLGGGGMPSQDGLIRTYYAAFTAKKFPDSKIIIALPGDAKDSTSAICLMKKEIVLRGVCPERILLEHNGTNTRSQALNIAGLNKHTILQQPVLLISLPEHMIRAIKTFEKAGFKNISGYPAFEKGIEANITFNDKKLGGNKLLVPEIGNRLQLRYQFWNHLKYELIITREVFGLAYYKLRGWV